MPVEATTYKLGRVENGHMVKAHLGYTPDLERFMYLAGLIHVFIYRDLRDVAVSQAYHILNAEPGHLVHPGADEFRALGGIPEILTAVIEGLGRWPGLVDRWQYYAPWLNYHWVIKVRYEDLRTDPKAEAERIYRLAMQRSAATWGRKVSFDPHGLDVLTGVMAKSTEQHDRSTTFRAGRIGDWRHTFTQDHVILWKKHDAAHWLEHLGYEGAEWYDDTGRVVTHDGRTQGSLQGQAAGDEPASAEVPQDAGAVVLAQDA
jgi:hypothetical protein